MLNNIIIVFRTRVEVHFSDWLSVLFWPSCLGCGLRAAELSVKPGHSKHNVISLPLFIFLYYISKNIDKRTQVLKSISNYLAFVTTQMGKSKEDWTEGAESFGELETLGFWMPCAPGTLSSVVRRAHPASFCLVRFPEKVTEMNQNTEMAILILLFSQECNLHHV